MIVLIGEHNSPSDWWAVNCWHQELSKVAIRIIEMPATSAACERSFSQHANIHSKKRNRLTKKHVEKLLYISHNLKLLEDDTRIRKVSSEILSFSSSADVAFSSASTTSTAKNFLAVEVRRERLVRKRLRRSLMIMKVQSLKCPPILFMMTLQMNLK